MNIRCVVLYATFSFLAMVCFAQSPSHFDAMPGDAAPRNVILRLAVYI